jgi:hypothetical protein
MPKFACADVGCATSVEGALELVHQHMHPLVSFRAKYSLDISPPVRAGFSIITPGA